MIEADISSISLARNGGEPLPIQLANALRCMILAGNLATGVKLPASRKLAESLGISRNAVNDAFALLHAECLLEMRHGAGTFVAGKNGSTGGDCSPAASHLLSQRSRQLLSKASAWSLASPDSVLAPGIPALTHFPLERWNRCALKASRAASTKTWADQDPAGYLPLRQAIAAQIGPSRGVFCGPEQIVILSSSREAFQLAALVLLEAGAAAAVEDPCLPELAATLAMSANRLSPCPSDEEGIAVDALDSACRMESIRLVFTTPTHQYPSGVEMSPQRRSDLLDMAAQHDFYIVEDDYDGEFRSSTRRQQSLFAQDTQGRVLYVGTFSKSIAPSLRLAFLALPPDLVKAFVSLKTLRDGSVSLPLQLAMHEFIASGSFTRHLAEMRQLYRMRRLALAEELRAELGGLMTLNAEGDGLHIVGHLPAEFKDRAIVDAAGKKAIGATALSGYCLKRNDLNGLVMGFAGWDAVNLKKAARTVANIVKSGT